MGVQPGTWDTRLWQQARGVFDDVVDAAPAEREAQLEVACADQPALRCAVQALLDHDDPTTEAASLTRRARGGERWLGTPVGPYRLQQVIGHGGAGIVFLAAREDGEFDHQVAVKILLDGPDAGPIDRFRQERQILAALDHPHIARLFDGGSTADGAPYVVMEYVEGVPVTTYCDHHNLALDNRLELFLQISDAVQHAHRCLVVHRDLKPSNILVTAEGQVKLLDFGIAQLLDDRPRAGGNTAPQTSAWLTPAYASPEQLLGAPTTIATDIYSLGVVLHELLTGRLPVAFAMTGEGGDGGAAVKAPSTVVDDDRHSAGAVLRARCRRTSPRQLARCLRGDLDAVVLRALPEPPRARYPNVEGLARDLERHRACLPVEARQGQTLYRVGKFVQRHALAVAVATALILATLTVTAIAMWQAIALAAERDATAHERIAAETIADNLADIVRLLTPFKGQQFDPAIQRILGRTATRIERELADQPELQAVLSLALGQVYCDLAFFDEAEPLLERVVAHRQRQVSYPAARAQAVLALAVLRQRQGRAADAEVLSRAALQIEQEAQEPDPSALASTLLNLAASLTSQAEYEEAHQLLEKAIELGDHSPTVGPQQRANLRSNLALVLHRRGDLDAAYTWFEEALALYNDAMGPENLNAATALNNLASLDMTAGRLKRAAERFRASLEIRRSLQGDDHPEVTSVQANLGAVLHLSGDYAAAEPLYREVLKRTRATLGTEHPDLITDLSNLGLLLREMDGLQEAEALLTEALQVGTRLLAEDHPTNATSSNNLGLVLLDRGQLVAARDHLHQGLEIRRSKLGVGHWKVGNSLTNLAIAALAADDPCTGRDLATQASTVLAMALSTDHWRYAVAQSVLGAALAQLGQDAAAEVLLVSSFGVIGAAKSKRSRAYRDAEARLHALRAQPRPRPMVCAAGGQAAATGLCVAIKAGSCRSSTGHLQEASRLRLVFMIAAWRPVGMRSTA